MSISVGDAMVCFNNVTIRPGTLAAAIEGLVICLEFHGDELADTSNESKHTAAFRIVNQHVEAIKTKWGQFKEEAGRYSCFGPTDLHQFEKRLWRWIEEALAILMNVNRYNRESRRLFDARLAEELLRLQDASNAESQAVSDRERELVFEAVALEERLEQARQAKRDQEGERRATGPSFQTAKDLADAIGSAWASAPRLTEVCGKNMKDFARRWYERLPPKSKEHARQPIKEAGRGAKHEYKVSMIAPDLWAHLNKDC